MIIDDYEAELARLRARYGEGERLTLLYQVGSFFELYASSDADATALGEVAGLMNVVLTRKNKAVRDISRSNPALVGFPVGALPKYLPVLVGADYTVAIVRQVGGGGEGGEGFARELTEVVSPATWADENAGDAEGRGTRLAVAWVERSSVGVASIDMSTGEGAFSEADDVDEAIRLLRAMRPRETVVIGGGGDGVWTTAKGVGLVHTAWTPPDQMARVSYQEAVIGRAFPPDVCGLLSPIEHAGLERHPAATAAYATALEFAYSHDERIVMRMRTPVPVTADGNVVIGSAEQLNITGTGSSKTLLTLLNTCKTAFGRRAFASRLLRPTSNVVEIERRLDLVTAMLVNERHVTVRQALVGVQDLERLTRRIALGRALPHEFASLADSGNKAYAATGMHGLSLLCAFEGWDLEAMRRGDLSTGALDTSDAEAATLATERMAAAAEVADIVRLTEAKDDGLTLSITARRFAAAAGKVAGLESRPGAGGALRLCHPAISARERASVALAARNREALVRLATIVSEARVAQDVVELVRATAELDITAAVADAATRHRYCRPTLMKAGRASFQARGLRHPIVERLLTDEMFTPNDVSIGTEGDGGAIGILLYGNNMAGKTTAGKSIGIAVIMAQAGMYVPATSLLLRPFDAILTRIAGGDDMFSGQSSFAVEMTELRTILRRATADSLVIGDEICNSTEALSGTAIVAQGIASFTTIGCSFVLATHIHALTSTKRVAELVAGGVVRVAHMHVETEADGTLIFHRTLREGQGQSTYGIEVARALGLGDAFMAGADAVRRELQGVPEHMVNPRTSRYNSALQVDTCFLCGLVADEVHHISHQANADADGFITGNGVFHKNARFNLVALCAACHDKQHTRASVGEAGTKKMAMTSRGRRIVTAQKPV